MSLFQDAVLVWGGRDYVIPAERRMGLIGVIEDHITLAELCAFATAGDTKFKKLSCAYGAALRYAGARVSDEEIYFAIYQSGKTYALVMAAINGLLAMMLPPGNLDTGAEEAAPRGNSPRRARRAAARSSKKPTKRRAAPGA